MRTKDLDIVYVVKNSAMNEELRYSLRSVQRNLPHRKIWIYGGCPVWCRPDEKVEIRQTGATKYDKVGSLWSRIATNEEITEDFILMNDDFYVMKKTEEIEPAYRATILEHIRQNIEARGRSGRYVELLGNVNQELEAAGIQNPLSYELHIPMIFNKEKLLETLEAFPGVHATRSLYGNFNHIGGKQMDDVKVFNRKQSFDPESQYLSSDDNTWPYHEVGIFIRKTFDQKSQWEK